MIRKLRFVLNRAMDYEARTETPCIFAILLGLCLTLTGCTFDPVFVREIPGVVLGVTLGVFFILSACYLGHYSKVLMADLIEPTFGPPTSRFLGWLNLNRQEAFFLVVMLGVLLLFSVHGFAQVRIPGTDETTKLKAAGTLLMLIDTALFVWLSRIFAGLCILSAGWLIKEQKFGPAVVCVIGALVIGTSPMWVQNIFEIGGGGGVFK